MTTLKLNNKVFTIIQIYPFKYNFGEGKEVLRIKISKDNHSYTELESDFTNQITNIEQYDSDILVNIYKGYTRDFKCNYANNEFEIELSKITQTELELAQTKADVIALQAVIDTLLGGTV